MIAFLRNDESTKMSSSISQETKVDFQKENLDQSRNLFWGNI